MTSKGTDLIRLRYLTQREKERERERDFCVWGRSSVTPVSFAICASLVLLRSLGLYDSFYV